MCRIIQYLCYTGFLQALRQRSQCLIRLFYSAFWSEYHPFRSRFRVLLSTFGFVSQPQPDRSLPAQLMIGFLAARKHPVRYPSGELKYSSPE